MDAPTPTTLAQGFADETTIASVVMLIFFSVGLTIFMYFFRTIGDLPRRHVDFGLQQRSMVKVCNPFVLELDEGTKDLKDMLRFNLSILCPCHVVIVWGPMIQALHDFILLPGCDVRRRMLTNVEETELDPLHLDVLQFKSEGRHSVAVPCPDSVRSEALGEMPRSRYPVAVFVLTPEEHARDRTHEPDDGGEGTRSEDSTHSDDRSEDSTHSDDRSEDSTHSDANSKDNSIVGLIAILHLKDAIVTNSSHIIAKYVKTAGIPIYSLQALFVSNESQSQETTPGRENARPPVSSDLRQRITSNHLTGQDSNNRNSPLNHQETTPSRETLPSSVNSKAHDETPHVKDKTFVCTGSGCRHNSCMDQDGCSCCCQCVQLKKGVINGNLTEGNKECGENLGMEGQGREEEGDDQRVDNDIGNNPDRLGNTANAFKPLAQCIVCQSGPAKCALLPCRHNCVCLQCLRLLDKCPLCRGVMESYFIVSSGLGEDVEVGYDTEDGEEEDEMMEEMQRQGVAAHFENFFERVNHMVGFA